MPAGKRLPNRPSRLGLTISSTLVCTVAAQAAISTFPVISRVPHIDADSVYAAQPAWKKAIVERKLSEVEGEMLKADAKRAAQEG